MSKYDKGRFDNGVSYFTYRMLEIAFPEDVVVCFYCPLLYKDKLDRMICKRTDEIIYNATYGVGYSCPLKDKAESTKIQKDIAGNINVLDDNESVRIK